MSVMDSGQVKYGDFTPKDFISNWKKQTRHTLNNMNRSQNLSGKWKSRSQARATAACTFCVILESGTKATGHVLQRDTAAC